MSWRTCYSGSNNIQFDFPPIMSDGRNYASWQPDAAVNQRIRKKEGIQSNWQYRQYLQNNGRSIMEYNHQEACSAVGLPVHFESTYGSTPASNVPHMFTNVFDTSPPGFGYHNSDLKNPYLSREQLNARLIAPSIVPHSSKYA